MIDGDELERSYKHHLSDYSEWKQRDHASNWMLIEDNLGENLSIDETMLQEDLVTILSNKDGHCKQGSVISIVRLTSLHLLVSFRISSRLLASSHCYVQPPPTASASPFQGE